MIKDIFTVDSEEIITLRPGSLGEKWQIIWLFAPSGEKASDWLINTKVSEYAETAKAMIACLPGGMDNEFYSEKVWNALLEKYPCVSSELDHRRLIGLGDSVVKIYDLLFTCPDRFFTAVGVSPLFTDISELSEKARLHMEMGRPVPHMVIADSADGQGQAFGDKINKYGFGMHVHSGRECSGWELADFEVKNCLAHLK